jgi:cytochrome P450
VASCLKERTDLERQIQDGTSKQPARRDIFHHIFEGARDPATGRMSYSDTELHMECELMLIAGSDTTSTAMAAMLFYLGVYPEVQAKLAEELRATFAKRDDIRMGPVMNSCQYLHAVINETLRMSSPVSTDLIREILPGGLLIDGQYYDQGALVSTSNYCLFYNDDVYHDPFTFDPERWIVNDQDPGSAARVALAESAFCSFSTGPRGCVGKNLALMELSMVSARLFHMFEVRLDDKNKLGGGNPNMMWGRRKTRQYQVKDAFIVRRDGPMVQFRLRK